MAAARRHQGPPLATLTVSRWLSRPFRAAGRRPRKGSGVADPEEARLVDLIEVLRLSKDTRGVAKYRQQLDDFCTKQSQQPLSVDAAIQAKEAAEQDFAEAIKAANALAAELEQAKAKVENCTAQLDSATVGAIPGKAPRWSFRELLQGQS